MAKERCTRKSFQDSLEDIKERMKEKRTKKLAKVATVSKVLSSKVKIIGNSIASVKSFQDNNKALALALEAEKCKTREAQDLILHLNREHQRLMLEIFMLRRKLNSQQADNSSGEKLASLKEIISKVTQNLLDTANLLGPAHKLCFSDGSLPSSSASREVKRSAPSVAPEPLTQRCESLPDAARNSSHVLERESIPGRIHRQEESSKNMTPGSRLSRARKSSSSRTKSDVEKPEVEAEKASNIFRNVSIRRRVSNLNVCREESSLVMSDDDQNLTSRCDIPEEKIVHTEEFINQSSNDDAMDVYPDQSPSKAEFISFTHHRQISSSTPETKPKPSQPLKGKTDSRTGREKVRKSRGDGQAGSQLKKPWEKSKPRTRSKSRERSASKPRASKDKINTSLNSGDAYDFVFEESVHLTPFRQSKQGDDPKRMKSQSAMSPHVAVMRHSMTAGMFLLKPR
ncbi:centromeric [Pristimantis euphronides]